MSMGAPLVAGRVSLWSDESHSPAGGGGCRAMLTIDTDPAGGSIFGFNTAHPGPVYGSVRFLAVSLRSRAVLRRVVLFRTILPVVSLCFSRRSCRSRRLSSRLSSLVRRIVPNLPGVSSVDAL